MRNLLFVLILFFPLVPLAILAITIHLRLITWNDRRKAAAKNPKNIPVDKQK